MPKNNKEKNKIKTLWDLTLLYKSEKDPQIEKDVLALENAYADFEKKYKEKTDYLNDENKLLKALQDFEKLMDGHESRPLYYFYFTKDLNATDPFAESQLNKYESRITVAGNKIIFFELNLGKIPRKLQEKFLKSGKLEHFRYYLKVVFDTSKYNLTEAEEKIINLKGQPARSLWISGQEKILNIQTVNFKGNQLSLPEAMSNVSKLPTKERRLLHNLIMEKLKSISFFAESEINAIYTNKKIDDELRGLKEPYSGTIISYQNNEKEITNLVNTTTKEFKISQKFYKLKAQLLKLPELAYADRQVSIGKISTEFSWDESVKIVSDAFKKVKPEFRGIFESYLLNGQIDVFPKQGKTGGAYCAGSNKNPTFVLLNHTSNIRNVMTVAHEMGHAIHTDLSKKQPVLYRSYTTAVAEVASTLFENFAFEEIFETLSPKEKVIALHDRISDDMSTVFRQIACFNFELELHRKIRSEGSLSKEEIGKILNRHMEAYTGSVMKFTENDGYFFVAWSHIRNFFYVYSYAYGQIISKALYKKYKEDKSFITEIEKFLSAGGSKSPEDIFKDIGIDTSKPEFFEAGLKSIEEDIKRLEKLAKEAKMI